jgi:hypothetical protein
LFSILFHLLSFVFCYEYTEAKMGRTWEWYGI